MYLIEVDLHDSNCSITYLKEFLPCIIVSSAFLKAVPALRRKSIVHTIEVTFNSVNLKVNGNKVQVVNILYNGTTYAQIRVIVDIFMKNTGWDKDQFSFSKKIRMITHT